MAKLILKRGTYNSIMTYSSSANEVLYDTTNKNIMIGTGNFGEYTEFYNIKNIEFTGVNLFSISGASAGVYLLASGDIGSSVRWYMSDYINITNAKHIIISGFTLGYAPVAATCFYDGEKTYIGGWTLNTTSMDVPSGAVYMRTSVPLAYLNTFKIEQGVNATIWTPCPWDGARGMTKVGSYYGLTLNDGTTAGYVRTTTNGFIPYSASSSGVSTIGTSMWPFRDIYAINYYENGTTLSNKYASKSHSHYTSDIADTSIGSTAGKVSVIHGAYVSDCCANRLSFLPAAGVNIEYSTDSGATWTDSGLNDSAKQRLFAMNRDVVLPVGPATTIDSSNTTTSMQTRVTISPSDDRYTNVNKIFIWVSTCLHGVTADIEVSTIGAKTTFTSICSGIQLDGTSGPNMITFPSRTFGGIVAYSSNYYAYRITFKIISVNSTYISMRPLFSEIRFYGDSIWASKNSMMKNGHLYSWDHEQNATFPAKVTTSGLTVNGARSTTLTGTLAVASTSTFAGSVDVVSGGLAVTGGATIRNSGLTVVGDSSIAGKLTISSGGLAVTGGTVLSNDLTVTGRSTFSNTVTINAMASVSKSFQVTNTSFLNDVYTTGGVYLSKSAIFTNADNYGTATGSLFLSRNYIAGCDYTTDTSNNGYYIYDAGGSARTVASLNPSTGAWGLCIGGVTDSSGTTLDNVIVMGSDNTSALTIKSTNIYTKGTLRIGSDLSATIAALYVYDAAGTATTAVAYNRSTTTWSLCTGATYSSGTTLAQNTINVGNSSATGNINMYANNTIRLAGSSSAKAGVVKLDSHILYATAVYECTGTGSTVYSQSDGKLVRSSSSIRYKMNVKYNIDREFYHNALMQFSPCEFEYKDNPGQVELGQIAEETEQLVPIAAIYNDDKSLVENYKDRTIIEMLIIEAQRKDAEIIELKQRLESIEKLLSK